MLLLRGKAITTASSGPPPRVRSFFPSWLLRTGMATPADWLRRPGLPAAPTYGSPRALVSMGLTSVVQGHWEENINLIFWRYRSASNRSRPHHHNVLSRQSYVPGARVMQLNTPEYKNTPGSPLSQTTLGSSPKAPQTHPQITPG